MTRVRAASLLVVILGLGLLSGARDADAATPIASYGYLTTFGEPGPVVSTRNNGVALDANGRIYVAEQEGSLPPSQAIAIYEPDPVVGGTLLTKIDLTTTSPGGVPATPVDVAVDPSGQTVYLRSFTGDIYRFVSDGDPVPSYTLDPNFSAVSGGTGQGGGLAVDPLTGDLLVAHAGSQVIRKLDASGSQVGSIPLGFGPTALAVTDSGDIYAVDNYNLLGYGVKVEHILPDGAAAGPLPMPAGLAPIQVAADPQSGEVVVLACAPPLSTCNPQEGTPAQYYLQGFSATGEPTFTERLRGEEFSQGAGNPKQHSPGGLAWDSVTDRIYYTADNGLVHTFVPAQAPGLDTPVAGNVEPTSADLSVGVAPIGTTNVRLEICALAPAFKNCASYPVSEDPLSPFDPTNPWQRLAEHTGLAGPPTTVSDSVSNLLPNTQYQVRAVAFDETSRTETTSALGTFRTATPAPVVTTGAATAVTDSSAELYGTIDTVGASTTYHFEYGLTANYGFRAPAVDAPAGNSRGPRVFHLPLTGLQSGTTYHYRLVATSPGGTSTGEDRTLTTLGPDEVAPDRAYEQVSPVDKGGAAILGLTHFAIAPDGSSMVIPVSAAPADATGARIFQHFVVHRGAAGWSDWSQTDPPQLAEGGIFESATLGVSADFDHALVVSSMVLAPGGISGGGNVYIKDVQTGAYTFVGASATPGANRRFTSPQVEASYFVEGAPDFSWVIFHAPVPLLPGVTQPAMYKWSRSHGLELLSLMPGDVIPGDPVWPEPIGQLTSRQASVDGQVAYFGLAAGSRGVFRRADGQTTPISVADYPGGPAGVQPASLDGVSADGNFAVFRSPSKLTEDPENTDQGGALTNLYRYNAETEDVEYLAVALEPGGGAGVYQVSEDAATVLFADDIGGVSIWRNGVEQHVVAGGVPFGWARLSPNGRYVAYRVGTASGITYDGTLYVYDSATQESTCVSCTPDGAPGSNKAFNQIDARGLGNQAAQVITDNGIAFFDTPARLVPADRNSTRDVYAWQHGQLTLISPGDGNYNARFVDASDDGQDVFFTTDQSLVKQDTDESTDMYDARRGGGFAEATQPPSCTGEACLGAPVPGPNFSTPGSAAGGDSAFAPRIGSIRPLSSADLRRLAGGKAARLSIQVNGPGSVRLSGDAKVNKSVRRVISSSAKATTAGPLSVSFSLSRQGLSALRKQGSLSVTLTVGFGGAQPKVLRFTLRAANHGKGGRS